MISKKVKGIILAVILSLASIMMPFSVYASVQSQIVPTFSSSTSEWNGHLYVTNFSDGTNNQASSTLAFTFDDDYYGMIYFDGYGPNNQLIANYATVFIAGGYGEYRYSYYQNGVINITSVTINIVNVVKPETTVDLTQIIQLLTAIENDTSAIDLTLDSTLTQITNVLNQLIISNGYLESLTKIRNWNVPIYSYGFIYSCYRRNYPLYEDNYFKLTYFDWPIFKTVANQNSLSSVYCNKDAHLMLIFGVSGNYGQSTINNFMNIVGYTDQNSLTYTSQQIIFDNYLNIPLFKIFKFDITSSIGQNVLFKVIADNELFIPIYFGLSDANFDTDFALTFGLSNRLLDNLDIIANGTTSSNSAASDLNDASSDYSSIADDVVNVENGLTTNFETEVNKINLDTGLNVFGGHFLTSATWVRTQFDRLTENTPYGSMVVYGLTLGFVLLMLGKVFL